MDSKESQTFNSAKKKVELLTFCISIGFVFCATIFIYFLNHFIDHFDKEYFFKFKWAFLFGVLFTYLLVRRRIHYNSIVKGFQIPSGEEVIAKCKAEHKPYALYLRPFNSEKVSDNINDLYDLGNRASSSLSRPVESVLIELMNKILPLITLPDPRRPVPKEGAHRLRKVHQDWEAFIKQTMTEASFVILYVSEFSPGIIQELKAIDQINIYSKTLIIFKNVKVLNQAKEHGISSFEYKIDSFSTTARKAIFQSIAIKLNDIALKHGMKVSFDSTYKYTYEKQLLVYYIKVLFLVPLILSLGLSVFSDEPFITIFIFYMFLITIFWWIIIVSISSAGLFIR